MTDGNTTTSTQEQAHKPLSITTYNGIETYIVNSQIMGTHALHWDTLTQSPEQDIPSWLGQSLENAVLPYGLTEQSDETIENNNSLLVAANDPNLSIYQLYSLDAQHQPSELITAFPYCASHYSVSARIDLIIHNQDTKEAVLRLQTTDGTILYAFDSLFSINQHSYKANTLYKVNLSGLCHTIEKFDSDETISITDADAIRHHRALHSVLQANNGIAPDDLQQQIENWQPTSGEDTAPVTISLDTMCAYLHGEVLAQEDEAWCQGEIVGMQTLNIFGTNITLFDLVILREETSDPVVIRCAMNAGFVNKDIKVGDFVRANIWLQANISMA